MDVEKCPASIEEPGLFAYDCELPKGHDGQHVVHWDQKIIDRPPPPPLDPNSGWAHYLESLFAPRLSDFMGRGKR